MRNIFNQRTYSIYRHQQARVSGSLPFTLEEFRFRLLAFLNKRPLCRYCQKVVEIKTVSFDHKIPVSRGGSLDLSNVEFICSSCNKRKGDFTDGEYESLLNHLEICEHECRNFTIKRRVLNALAISQSFRQGAMRRAKRA